MLRLLITFLSIFLFYSSVFALNTELLDIRLQRNLENIEERLADKDLFRKVFIYTNLKRYTEAYLSEATLWDNKRYVLTESLPRLQDKITQLEWIIKLSDWFVSQNTFSLSFNNFNIPNKIEENRDSIKSAKSIFLFRDAANLSRNSMKQIVESLKEINPNILIFIDQEWGQINRYQDFDSEYSRDDLLDDIFIQLRREQLTDAEYNLFLSLFPTWNTYFPSLYSVWNLYDSYDEDRVSIMLEMFAYMRLQSHKDIWINTYGLVTDLSRGNPSITPLWRSFSKHSNKYKLLLNAFAKASRETWVFVYLKHFPWVGLGSVDSHNGVLDLRNSSEELSENIELFAHARSSFWSQPLWAMIGHVLISDDLKSHFLEIASSFDFLITDDLAMQWYIWATNKTYTNWFFSTDVLSNSSKLMVLDRKSSFYIK